MYTKLNIFQMSLNTVLKSNIRYTKIYKHKNIYVCVVTPAALLRRIKEKKRCFSKDN